MCPGGPTPVNAKYIVDALGKFLKGFKQKRPKVVAWDWRFHEDNTNMHTAHCGA
jgi:hypothetical protein